jgi:hypothetical protein
MASSGLCVRLSGLLRFARNDDERSRPNGHPTHALPNLRSPMRATIAFSSGEVLASL